ncbi:hypothetical protein, partial [Bordetella pertussis]
PPADINVVAGANRYDYGRRTRLQPTGRPRRRTPAPATPSTDRPRAPCTDDTSRWFPATP